MNILFPVLFAVLVYLSNGEVSDEKANERITACCQATIKPQCQHLCKYTSEQQTLLCSLNECVGELKKWMYCAADGGKNRKCCKDKNINPICYDFCGGDAPKVDSLSAQDGFLFMSQCVPDAKANSILKCHQDNLDESPNWNKSKFPNFQENISDKTYEFLEKLNVMLKCSTNG